MCISHQPPPHLPPKIRNSAVKVEFRFLYHCLTSQCVCVGGGSVGLITSIGIPYWHSWFTLDLYAWPHSLYQLLPINNIHLRTLPFPSKSPFPSLPLGRINWDGVRGWGSVSSYWWTWTAGLAHWKLDLHVSYLESTLLGTNYFVVNMKIKRFQIKTHLSGFSLLKIQQMIYFTT